MTVRVTLDFMFENLEQRGYPFIEEGPIIGGGVYRRWAQFRGNGSVRVELVGNGPCWFVESVRSADDLRIVYPTTTSHAWHAWASARQAVTDVVQKISAVHGRAWATNLSISLEYYDHGGVSFDPEDYAWLQNLLYHPDMQTAMEDNPLNTLTDVFVHFARAECPHWKVSETMLVRDTASGLWRVAVKELGSEVSGRRARTPEAALVHAVEHLSACRTSRGAMTGEDRDALNRFYAAKKKLESR